MALKKLLLIFLQNGRAPIFMKELGYISLLVKKNRSVFFACGFFVYQRRLFLAISLTK